MKTVLIIHGIAGHAGIHWQKWLHDELVKKGYKVLMPNMPRADHPDRSEWLQKIVTLTKEDRPLKNLTMVGHSLGVTTVLDFIEQAGSPITKLISVSGFGDDYGHELNSYFLGARDIKYKKVRNNLKNAQVLYGDDDPFVPQKTLKKLADDLSVKPIVIEDGGHLNTKSGYTKFPKLLELITQ
ncbi:RBBP9/YdeN family alpha/beta hydrolase [Patescibacteria group bacterium]